MLVFTHLMRTVLFFYWSLVAFANGQGSLQLRGAWGTLPACI